MAKDKAYARVDRKFAKAHRSGARKLDLLAGDLTELPESLGQLTQLQSLTIFGNKLTALPESLGQLTQLQSLRILDNQLTALPESIGQLTQLQSLMLNSNQLTALPESLTELKALRKLYLHDNRFRVFPNPILGLTGLELLAIGGRNGLTSLPDSIDRLANLETLDLGNGELMSLPSALAGLGKLKRLVLTGNPLNPELAAAYNEGLDAVKRYLRANATGKVVLNEAKLILIGEGEVGKTCLLGALRGDPWEEGRPTTHGIEIKPVKVTAPAGGMEITLNGWDFGGQPVYRPTHQLFFSAPAVYLVVWKPREGPQQGFVKEWIKLVKHREPEAKILVVATHGGPKERQPDIDRQEIWDLFGKDTVIDFLSVESKPNEKGERQDIAKLKDVIARVAASLPEMGRSVPKHWHEARKRLRQSKEAYLPLDRVFAICKEHNIEEEDARLLLRICRRVGDMIYYEHDPVLREIVVIKPDWLATAMSFVLEDKQTRESHGLVEFTRLGEVWNDPSRPAESRYHASLHPLFLRLMERFDLSYKVAVPTEPEDALSLWQRVGRTLGIARQPPAELHYTSLVAQLVPDVRPELDLAREWSELASNGDHQQVQICRIVETQNGRSATAEGLFFQLIVRLHKYSLGRASYRQSVHWQRGLVLDDDYNGRALLEHVGNDIRITVRAPYPQAFLAVLTHEVKWLVESFWKGMRCDVMVPCIEPCGRKAPGTGLYEVQKLVESKRDGHPLYPCPVCNKWQDIDCLLRNAPAARPDSVVELLAEFGTVRAALDGARQQLMVLRGETMGRFDKLDLGTQRILSKVDDAFTGLMTAFTDEAKEGPRLFSFVPVDPGFLDRPKWLSEKFRITLWCERSRLPLPTLNGKDDNRGVYELSLPRDWFVTAAPFLKVLTGTLSLVVPVASSATKLVLDDAAYKGIEKQLDLGQKSLDSVLKGSGIAGDWLGHGDAPDVERGAAIEAHGAVLRQVQAWLKEKDPGFGGLVRVQNRRQEFLWVHPQFEKEY